MEATPSPSMLSKLFTTFKAYHAKHPIITSYCLMSSVLAVVWGRTEYLADRKMQCVSKYKTTYIVMRSDDPRTTMIKRGPIGMDY